MNIFCLADTGAVPKYIKTDLFVFSHISVLNMGGSSSKPIINKIYKDQFSGREFYYTGKVWHQIDHLSRGSNECGTISISIIEMMRRIGFVNYVTTGCVKNMIYVTNTEDKYICMTINTTTYNPKIIKLRISKNLKTINNQTINLRNLLIIDEFEYSNNGIKHIQTYPSLMIKNIPIFMEITHGSELLNISIPPYNKGRRFFTCRFDENSLIVPLKYMINNLHKI